MDSVFTSQLNIKQPKIIFDKKIINNLFIIILISIIIFAVYWYNNNLYKENMSGGTMAQMFAQDSQDIYLKNNVNKLATGNFNLFWNQPTRQANILHNRGQTLNTEILPKTSMNPKNNKNKPTYINPILQTKNKINYDDEKFILPYNNLQNDYLQTDYLENNNSLKEIDYLEDINSSKEIDYLEEDKKKIVKNILPSSNPNIYNKVVNQLNNQNSLKELPVMTKWTSRDYLFQDYMDNALNNNNCLKNSVECSNLSSDRRLLDGFNQSTKAITDININENTFYPDSYVGNYFI
jgi:hypothetical protein